MAFGVVMYQFVGGFQNFRSRTVVFNQLIDLCVGKFLIEVQNVFNFGSAPAVNRLVVVADDENITVLSGYQFYYFVLYLVRILEFVDVDISETSAAVL